MGGLCMENGYYELKDLKVGMKATSERLKHIMNRYMIIAYDNLEDPEGTLVFLGKRQTKEYDKWFFQNKPITPIYHGPWELEENVVYDE